MADQLLLIRHAGIGPTWAGRYVGRTDLPLGPDGLREAQGLAALVQSRKAGCCFSSPLARAAETARTIAQAAGLAVEVDQDLREVDFGRWEGRTFAEIAAADPDAVARWAAFGADFAFPGGESLAAFLDRVSLAAERLAAHPAKVVMAVTHGGVIRTMICRLLGLDPRSYVLFSVRTASAATIDLYEGRGVLSGLNETAAALGTGGSD